MGISYDPTKPIRDSEFEINAKLLRQIDGFRKSYMAETGVRLSRADAIRLMVQFSLRHGNLIEELAEEHRTRDK